MNDLPLLPDPMWPEQGRDRPYRDAYSERQVRDVQREAYELGKRAALAAAQPKAEPVAWRDHVEQRIRTWRQRTMNCSGDRLAIDDFMGQDSIDDLVDFVCDEWTDPPAPQPKAEPVAWRIKERINGEFDSDWNLLSFEPPTTPRTIAIEALYTTPPAPQPVADDKRDAERYRWLRRFKQGSIQVVRIDSFIGDEFISEDDLDAAIDAAMKDHG